VHDPVNAFDAVVNVQKLRVCVPSPQISIECRPESRASSALRQMAAGAFSRPPNQVPYGP